MRKGTFQKQRALSSLQKSSSRRLLVTLAVGLFCAFSQVHAGAPVARTPLSAAFSAKTFDDFVSAIHQHESDGRIGRIFGDGGRSYGPLQISHRAWSDAVRFDRSIGGKYSDCSSLKYSRRIMLAYLRCHDARALERGDWESCARLWNSGPDWRRKIRITNEYWAAVRTYLAQVNS